VAEDEEFRRALVRTALQEVLEAEMTEALSDEKGARTAGRHGYRVGVLRPDAGPAGWQARGAGPAGRAAPDMPEFLTGESVAARQESGPYLEIPRWFRSFTDTLF
jgi:hypothetical protein